MESALTRSPALCRSLAICSTTNRHRLSPLRISITSSSRKCKFNARRSDAKNIAPRINCSLVELDDEACELVNGKELLIGEDDHNIHAYLFQAVKNNNGTGILLLSDVFGFEDSATRDFAYRVACNGYNVLLPDLFRGDPWGKHRPQSGFEQWIARQDPERVANDIAMATEWMVEAFVTAGLSKKLGLIGFCFGGGKVIEVLARDQGAYFGTGVSFYGKRIDPSLATNVKVPVLFVSGDSDPLCSVGLLENLEKSIGRGSRREIFRGRGHGFVHRPQSPEEDEDAERAFLLTRNWLHDGLVDANN